MCIRGTLTRFGNTSRSCKSHVLSSVALIRASLVARLISAVASRSRIKALSTSMCEFGQSVTGVYFSSSANRSGYLQTRCIG